MNIRTRVVVVVLALGSSALWGLLTPPAHTQCVDYSHDPAGCQPSTFDTPIGLMPSVRVNAQGELDPFSSEAEARAGVAALEDELNLFWNFENLHWVLTVPSEREPGTRAWRGGDLDGAGDARGLGIAGQCAFVGHRNGAGATHAINIFRIQPDPERDPPVQVGEIPAMAIGNEGFDDRELRSLVYTTAAGDERQILVRNAGTNRVGRLKTYAVDMTTCLPLFQSATYDFNGPSHEFFLWHDPRNANRVLVFVAMFAGGGLPDPENPGLRIPDAVVLAVTDEETGDVLPNPQVLAGSASMRSGGRRQTSYPTTPGSSAMVVSPTSAVDQSVGTGGEQSGTGETTCSTPCRSPTMGTGSTSPGGTPDSTSSTPRALRAAAMPIWSTGPRTATRVRRSRP